MVSSYGDRGAASSEAAFFCVREAAIKAIL